MAFKTLINSMVVLGLVALVLTTIPVYADDCQGGIIRALHPCTDFLGSLIPLIPSTECCNGAKSLVGLGADNVCQCLKLKPIGFDILPSKAGLLPNLCSLTSLVPIVTCLIPLDAAASPPV